MQSCLCCKIRYSKKKKDDSISVPIELVQSMKQLERRFLCEKAQITQILARNRQQNDNIEQVMTNNILYVKGGRANIPLDGPLLKEV